MFAVPWFQARGYEPIRRYRDRDIANWYFAPRDRARKEDRRVSETGRAKMRELRAVLAKEPAGSDLRGFYTPRAVLDEGAKVIPNPEHHQYEEMLWGVEDVWNPGTEPKPEAPPEQPATPRRSQHNARTRAALNHVQ